MVAEQALGSGRRWEVFLTGEGAMLPGRLALRLAGPEGENKGFQALCALGPAALGRALVDHWVHDTLQHQVAAGGCSEGQAAAFLASNQWRAEGRGRRRREGAEGGRGRRRLRILLRQLVWGREDPSVTVEDPSVTVKDPSVTVEGLGPEEEPLPGQAGAEGTVPGGLEELLVMNGTE
jgi:hypothetical protein